MTDPTIITQPANVVNLKDLAPSLQQQAIRGALAATADWVKKVEPSTPSASTATYVSMALRQIVPWIAAYFGFQWHFFSGSDFDLLAAILIGLASVAWSSYQKWQAGRREDQIAQASSAASAKVTAAVAQEAVIQAAQTGNVVTVESIAVPVQPPSSKLAA